jgi:membrane protein
MRFFALALAAIAASPLAMKIFVVSPDERIAQNPFRPDRKHARFSFGELKATAVETFRNAGRHNTSLLAAGVAFYALFAIFPALGAATWVFGLLADPSIIHDQVDSLKGVLPAEAWQVIDKQLVTLTGQSAGFSVRGVISLFIALFSARLAASSMMGALNTVYGVPEERSFVTTNAIALLFTVLAIVVFVLALAAFIAVPVALNYVGLRSVGGEIVRYARWPFLAAIMILALAITYRFGPDRDRARWKWLTWGSGLATLLWLIASFGFSWYVSAFNSYDKVYGSIGAVVILLFWFWITSYSGLLGAELDNIIERRRGVPPK